jgi:hypothetical protein
VEVQKVKSSLLTGGIVPDISGFEHERVELRGESSSVLLVPKPIQVPSVGLGLVGFPTSVG